MSQRAWHQVLRHALFNGNGVARRLIVALVLFSSALTAIITTIQLYGEYRSDVAQIHSSFDYIRQSSVPVLTDSVWVSDELQIITQISGLLNLRDLEYVEISVDGAIRWSAGTPVSRRIASERIVLTHQYRGEEIVIGELHIVASLDNVWSRIWKRLILVLIENGIKTFLVALFMLLVFQLLVTRHLASLSLAARNDDPKNPQSRDIELDRAPGGRWRPDALDHLVNAINRMRSNLRSAYQEAYATSLRLQQSEEQLRRANTDLEQRVAARTRELVQARDEAERANEAKSAFLSRMSHELRTPMNAILGFAQLLESHSDTPLTAEQADSVHEILYAGNHLLELINDILDLARIESGHVKLEAATVDLEPLVSECIALVKPLAEPAQVELSAVISPGLAAHADPLRLRQVIINLLSNAIKYNRAHGKVTLTAQPQDGNQVRIAVSDTGHGITAQDVSKLFQPFERVGNHSASIEGTGIGLALSQRLVENMGGRMGVESVYNQGSTFWFVLPAARQQHA